jgi:hypothetical protein
MKDIADRIIADTLTSKDLSPVQKDLFERVAAKMNISESEEGERLTLILSINFLNENDLKGLVDSLEILEEFVGLYGSKGEFEKGSRKALEFLTRLRTTLKDIGLKVLCHACLKPDNPQLYFHAKSREYPSYKILSLACHRALKDVEQILEELQKDGKITKRKAQNRMEGIVVPFIHAVHLYEVDTDDEELTLTPNISKIRAAIEKGKEDATVRYRTESTIDAYTRDVRLALSGTYSPHASRYVAKKSWGIQVLYGKRFMEEKITGWESTPDSPPGNFVFTFIEQTQEEAAEGSYPLEDADESSEEDKDIVRRIPRSADPISPCIPSVLSLRDFAAGLSERNSQYFKKFAAIAAAFVELPSRYQPLLPLPSAYPLI